MSFPSIEIIGAYRCAAVCLYQAHGHNKTAGALHIVANRFIAEISEGN
jgi:hypothetical protein